MVELRKRKAAAEPAPPPAHKKNSKPIKKAVDKAKEAVSSEPVEMKNGTGKLAVADTIELDGFGGEVETLDGEKTNMKKLVDNSKAGVVLFTYPKASTPGCECCLLSSFSSRIKGGPKSQSFTSLFFLSPLIFSLSLLLVYWKSASIMYGCSVVCPQLLNSGPGDLVSTPFPIAQISAQWWEV
jgi:hypothetical protein